MESDDREFVQAELTCANRASALAHALDLLIATVESPAVSWELVAVDAAEAREAALRLAHALGKAGALSARMARVQADALRRSSPPPVDELRAWAGGWRTEVGLRYGRAQDRVVAATRGVPARGREGGIRDGRRVT